MTRNTLYAAEQYSTERRHSAAAMIYARVEFASFGKLPNLEEPIGSIDF